MGGGARFPYPREVWSPSGGWWTRPSNWKTNTGICFALIGGLTYATWKFSARNEVRIMPPTRAIPSQRWSQQAREIGIREE